MSQRPGISLNSSFQDRIIINAVEGFYGSGQEGVDGNAVCVKVRIFNFCQKPAAATVLMGVGFPRKKRSRSLCDDFDDDQAINGFLPEKRPFF
jgi:hypothetical protein